MIRKFQTALLYAIPWMLVIICGNGAYARQDTELSFKIITDIESQAITFLKDRDGFVWIGSYVDGLYRYDGKNLKQFLKSSGLVLGYNISAIIEDHDGILWFAASGGGLSSFNKATNQVKHYQHDPQNPQTLSSQNTFWAGKQVLMEDPLGSIWLGTIGGGVNRLDKKTGRVARFQYQKDNPKSLSNNNVRSLYTDQKGTVWIGTEYGLNRFDAKTETFKHYLPEPNNPQSISDKVVSFIFEDTRGRFWIGTESGGLNRMDRQTQTFRQFMHAPENADSIPNNRIVFIFEYNPNELWICHETEASLFNPETETFRSFKGSPRGITMMLNDSESGMLWALYDRGVVGNFHPA